MQRRAFLSSLVAQGCLGTMACGLSGCGTLLHNDRCGQPHSHQIDWKIVALDGLGMLLFFVPGAVAFAVDFYTGAIYLPLEYDYGPYDPYGSPVPSEPVPPGLNPPVAPPAAPREPLPAPPPYAAEAHRPPPQLNGPPPNTSASRVPASLPDHGLRRLPVPREQLDPRRLEQVVSRHLGRPVSLDDERVRLSVLPRLDRFHEQARRHESDRQFGFAVRSFLERFRRA